MDNMQRYYYSILTIVSLLIVTLVTRVREHKVDWNSQLSRKLTTGIDHRNLKRIQTKEKAAIATLVPHNENDIDDFCYALASLKYSKVVREKTPILVFHEKSFPFELREKIRSCTVNPLYFLGVTFETPKFKKARNKSDVIFYNRVSKMGQNLGRQKWGYCQMIRFWTTLLWKYKVVGQFDTIMRIDTDSCFTSESGRKHDSFLPSLPPNRVYRANSLGLGSNIYIRNLYKFALEYMTRERIVPSNPQLWEHITSSIENPGLRTLPVFQSNFEVNRVSFFKRRDVMRWHAALTEKEPFGIFRYRWGDAQTRVFTMALFATKDDIEYPRHPGYIHGRGKCKEWVESLGGLDVLRQKISEKR